MHAQQTYVSYIHAKRRVCFIQYIYANTDWRIFLTRKQEHACVSYTRMNSVLLLWTPSLNDRSKSKGECTDVKSGCGTSVGPMSKTPVSVKTKILCNCPCKCFRISWKYSKKTLRETKKYFWKYPYFINNRGQFRCVISWIVSKKKQKKQCKRSYKCIKKSFI